MNERISKLEDKLDKMEDSLHSIDKTLIRQEEQLAVHMKRSELNEENNKLLKEYIDQQKNESDIRLRKLEGFKDKAGFLGWLGMGALSVFEMLHKLNLF